MSYDSSDSMSQFDARIKQWIKDFNRLYLTSDVTPYMHAFSQYISEFLELYQNVSYFNQQGLEKFNDTSSKDYFRSTSHRNIEALRQMMLKKQRAQLLEAVGCQHIKHKYKCRNCLNMGHSIKKCTSKCNNVTKEDFVPTLCLLMENGSNSAWYLNSFNHYDQAYYNSTTPKVWT